MYQVFRQIIDLAETCNEGIEYIKNKLEVGCFEETVPLLIDFVNAFHAIEKALKPIESLLMSERLGTLFEILRQNLDLIVTAYEQRDLNKAFQVMGQKLLPSYKEWHAELDGVLLPVVVS